jgi:ribosomal-protein-alanine N-acetyltransferase
MMPGQKRTYEVTSERLILREPEMHDGPSIVELAGAFEIADTTLRIPHPYNLGQAQSWIKEVRRLSSKNSLRQWVIILQKGRTLIGAIGLSGIDYRHRHGELGYWIGKPWWGRGYATEAAKTVLHYAFWDLNLHRVYAHHFVRNEASGRVLQKAGMVCEGIMREHVNRWGRYEDIKFYGVLNPSHRSGNISDNELRIE